MIASPERQQLRHEVSQIVLGNCKLGVYIAPVSERSTLLCGIVTAVREMIVANDLPLPQQVFIDQGIHGKPEDVDKDRVTLIPSCDSRTVLGIQLADYAAYHCSYLLKCALEGTSKSVRIGSVPHQLSDEEVHLDWMIRTEIRRNFFSEYRDLETIKGDDWFFKVAGFGSFFSRGLDAELQLHATDVFNQMYFGCVW